jgi:N-acetylglucosaminyldiphosphoundecaprenol N-acetyl-beta-D-mannosaminyltransferase
MSNGFLAERASESAMTNGAVILGVPIDNVSTEETLQKIEEFIRDGSFHQIATANVDYLVNAANNQQYREILCGCDLVVADGMPVVWASRLLGSPLTERVAGADLVPRLAHLSRQEGYGIFLLGATPEVSSLAASRLEDMGARIVGRLSPPVCSPDEFDNDYMLAEIERANPDILLVAFGSPKQELWIHQHRDRLNVPVCIGIGGSLNFLAGAVARAPGWMQRAGLEWAYRILVEPRRLVPRYLKDAVGMARYFSVQLALSMATRRSGDALQIDIESIGSVSILRVSGMMTGPQLAQLERVVLSVADRGRALVIELTGVSYLGADGVRTLVGLLRAANNSCCQLWLAGVPAALARTLRASCCEGLFRMVPTVFDAVQQASRGRLQLSLELCEGSAVCRIGGEIPPRAREILEGVFHQVLASRELQFDSSGAVEPTRSAYRFLLGDRSRRPVTRIAV